MGKLTVHCRTGSLEKSTAKETFKKSSSLPHRQLRNVSDVAYFVTQQFTAAQAA